VGSAGSEDASIWSGGSVRTPQSADAGVLDGNVGSVSTSGCETGYLSFAVRIRKRSLRNVGICEVDGAPDEKIALRSTTRKQPLSQTHVSPTGAAAGVTSVIWNTRKNSGNDLIASSRKLSPSSRSLGRGIADACASNRSNRVV